MQYGAFHAGGTIVLCDTNHSYGYACCRWLW